MKSDYTVFISAKYLDEAGNPTKDREIAHELWEFLTGEGFRVFFSDVSLERMGVSAYTEAIDDALDRAKVLVVVCTSGAHVVSTWVKYEWGSFLNAVRSETKPDGHVFVYLVGESIRNLPWALRHTQCIQHGADGFARLARFIANATGEHLLGNEATPSAGPGTVGTDRFSALAGEWEGEWKRDGAGILHRGRLSISHTGGRLSAELRVTFEKRGQKSVVKESLRAVVTPRSVVLQGESVEYEERGASTSYLLDHFELQPDSRNDLLCGDFYSKRGRGCARFWRIATDLDEPGTKGE